MDDKKALLFIREEIDSIDSELISLLESRLNLSLEIGKIKKRMDKDLFDESRQSEILKKSLKLAKNFNLRFIRVNNNTNLSKLSI